MDLNRIERLTSALRRMKEAKFVSDSSSVSMEKISYLTEDTAREIRNELNAAIAPIMNKLKNELKKEMLACAKDV